VVSYFFRLPPGPRTVEYAKLAEDAGYEGIWTPEVPAFGHDIWITMARVAEATSRISVGPAVLIPSYRHPLAQASAIATVAQLAPGRVLAGFGTGFTGRQGLGLKPLTMKFMARYLVQVRGLLRGEAVDLDDGGLAQLSASEGWLPSRPIDVPLLLAANGPKGHATAREVADGLITGAPEPGSERCYVPCNGTVLADGEDLDAERVRKTVAPLVATTYHSLYSRDPESVKRLPNGEAWLASVQKLPERERMLSVHTGHTVDVSNDHDSLVGTSMAKQVTFTGTRDELRARIDDLVARGATGMIFGTGGLDVPRDIRAFAEVAGL
jgi:5,10-methylenetetrahydromethanopterin reductase